MATALADAGVHVTVVTTDDDGPGRHLQGVPLGQKVPMNGWDAIYFRKQSEFYKASLPLRQWLRGHVMHYDIVHIHAVFSFASLVAGHAAAAAAVPYVVRPLGVLNRWGVENRRRYLKALSLRWLELPMLRKAAAMHYTSRMELNEVARFHLGNLQQVVPLGIDLRPFDNLPARQLFSEHFPETAATRNILFLSRIDEKKGLDLLIEAFCRIAVGRPDIRLVICGGGSPAITDQGQRRAASLGLADRVTWTGHVSGELRFAAYSAAEIFVLPSHSENFGIALLEAMAAGLPCLSTDQVALAADAAADQAVMLAARHPAAIAGALVELLDSAPKRQSLAANARLLAQRQYSLQAMADGLLALYRTILTPS
jgi:glycosyltransferase involved in cell wall biosynthesis